MNAQGQGGPQHFRHISAHFSGLRLRILDFLNAPESPENMLSDCTECFPEWLLPSKVRVDKGMRGARTVSPLCDIGLG